MAWYNSAKDLKKNASSINWNRSGQGAVQGAMVAGPYGAAYGAYQGNKNASQEKQDAKAAAAAGNPYQNLYDSMPTARTFTDSNGNLTGMPSVPMTTDKYGDLKDQYKYTPQLGNINSYKQLNIGTPQNTNADGTLKSQFAVDPTLVNKNDIERVGYQDFGAQRGLEERGVDRSLDNSYQNTLNSLSSQGGLSAADRMAVGKGQGRDRANAYADLAGRFGQLQSDNRYNTDVKNAEFGNAFLDKNADLANTAKYYNSSSAMGEGWKTYDANFDQGKYNADVQNKLANTNLSYTNDSSKTNSSRTLDNAYKTYDAKSAQRIAGINQSNNEFNNNLSAWGKKGEMISAGRQADIQAAGLNKKPSTTDRLLKPWEGIGK
jgi:hypothetical protein